MPEETAIGGHATELHPLTRNNSLLLSKLGFGGVPIGNLYQAVTEEDAIRIVQAAYAQGIRYFDTAPLYGAGLSEIRMGRAFANLPKKDFVLSSKVGWLLEEDADNDQVGAFVDVPGLRNVTDYSRGGTMRSLESSLKRLGVDRLDIVFIHDVDTPNHGAEALPGRFKEAMEGAYPALEELRAAGTIGAIGIGVNEWQILMQAMQHADLDCFLLAGRYTLLDQSSLAQFLPECSARGIDVVIGGPYNSGILASGPVPGATYEYRPAEPEILARAKRLQEICAKHDVPLAAAALQFPSHHPAIRSVIPGPRTLAEVTENIRLFNHPIPAALWQEMKAEGLIASAAPTPE